MVVKKKMTYKKQKGGLVLPEIPEKLNDYFNFIKFKINDYNRNIEEANPNSQYDIIKWMIDDIKLRCGENQKNIYILNLSIKLLEILFNYSKGISYKRTMELFVTKILYDIFIIPIDNFVNKLIKIFINMLFNQYLLTQPGIAHSIILLLTTFHLEFRDNEYLIGLLRTLFLEDYRIVYEGVPVFYGNIYDSDPTHLKYNRFICEKVGITSKEKRNYIINPVGALIQPYLAEQRSNISPLLISRLTELFKKILQYQSIRGNKIRTDFIGIPKLRHLNDPSKFCIALDRDGKEYIVQHSTLRMCSKLYGCALRMTPIIRDENIASNQHILELLLILLEIELDNPVSRDIYNRIEAYVIPAKNKIPINRRRNGSAFGPMQTFNNPRLNLQAERNRMKRREYYQQQLEITIKNNTNKLHNLKERLRTAIREINKELGKSVYTDQEKNRLNEKKRSLEDYLREI